jgi:hypothetical protein
VRFQGCFMKLFLVCCGFLGLVHENSEVEARLPMPMLNEPWAVIWKLVTVEAFFIISAFARDVSDACSEREDIDFSISISARDFDVLAGIAGNEG